MLRSAVSKVMRVTSEVNKRANARYIDLLS
jgi:hypothetical protein